MSGCWNSREMNEFGIVQATAIDLDENNQWVTSFQVVIPGTVATQAGSAGNQAPVNVFSTTGKTLEEAFQNANTETSRALFLAHNRVVIMSENVANRGVNQIIDFYLRDIESRGTMNIILTKGNPRRLLEVLTPLEKVPGNFMGQLLELGQSNLSNISNTKLHDFVSVLTNPTASATLPEIKIEGEQEEQTALNALQNTSSLAVIKLGETGIFKGEKLEGWLNKEESVGLGWISDSISNAVITFPCEGTDNSKQLSSFFVEKSSTKLKPGLTNGKLEMLVEIKTKGTLNETACKLNLKKPKNIKKLEKQIEDQIIREVEMAFEGAKKLELDALGFGDAFHKKYPNEWKEMSGSWAESFTSINMSTIVDVNIRRTGMINESFSILSTK